MKFISDQRELDERDDDEYEIKWRCYDFLNESEKCKFK